MDLNPAHQPVEKPGQQEHFAEQGQAGDAIDVNRAIEKGDNRRDQREHEGLQGEETNVDEQHSLHDHEQLDDQHARGQ